MATPATARVITTYLERSRLWNARVRVAVRWQTVAVFTLAALACAIFGSLTIAQHRAFNSHAYDLSWFDQSAWNTARGHWLASSFSHGSYLKEHFSPVLLLLGIVYRFWASPEALLSVQALFAALPAIPLYFAAAHALRSPSAGLMVATAYLLSPHLHGYVLFDFHPDIIAVVFIFASFALLDAGRTRAALWTLAPAFLVKEDVGLVGIGFAVLFWLYGHRQTARRLLAASVLYILLAEIIVVVIPTLLNWYPSGEQSRYVYLLRGGLNDPLLLWRHLSGPLQQQAIAYIAGSQALLPLAGPAALVPVVDVLPHLLADHKPQVQLTLQYPIYPLALLLVASVFNIKVIGQAAMARRLWARTGLPAGALVLVLAGLLLSAETVSWLIGSPLGLHVRPERFQTNAHTAAIERVIQFVPPLASLSAQSGILPHLSQRDNIREFPFLDNAAYVVIDRKGFRAWQAEVAGYDRVLASLSERYCLLRADDGVELYAINDLCEAPYTGPGASVTRRAGAAGGGRSPRR